MTMKIAVGGGPPALEPMEAFQPADDARQRTDLGGCKCPGIEWGKPDSAEATRRLGSTAGQCPRRLRRDPGQQGSTHRATGSGATPTGIAC